MSQYLLYTDPHVSDRPPSSCTDSYLDDLLDLLRQTVAIARLRGVIAVVIAGDVFHSKSPARVSHRLVQLMIEVIRSYHCPVFIVPGNHDIRNDRLDSIHETQPLGVLYRAGAIRLEGWGGYDAHHQYMLYGVPWQQGYGQWEEGDAADEGVLKALHAYRNRQHSDDERKALVVTHAPLYPPGSELEYEYFPAARWADAMGDQGYCFYGHVHEPHGVWTLGGVQSVTFCNNGALSRGSLHEYNLIRDVGCTIWDDETGQFEFIPLAAKPADQVFRLQEKQQATDMNGRLDAFLADIGHTTLDVLSAEQVLVHIRSLGLGQSVETLAEELLAEAARK